MIDIATIPPERLAMLDAATLFNGSHHGGTGGPDCQHCARELLHEVVTGKHRDETPEGVSLWIGVLPSLNDGPWRDDAHRTAVMRPYLRRLLALDPAQDEARMWPFLDWTFRMLAPDLFDALGMTDEAAKFRGADPITDHKSALDLALALDLARARALALALDLARARALALALALDLARALAAARDQSMRPDQWEKITISVLDRICAPIP